MHEHEQEDEHWNELIYEHDQEHEHEYELEHEREHQIRFNKNIFCIFSSTCTC